MKERVPYMDWNPSIEREVQRIPKGHASHNPQEQEYGYRAQQPQSQSQQYSTLYSSAPIPHYVPRVSFGERLGAFISYLFIWPAGFVFFLFSEKQNRFVRFHALQSLLFFGGLNIAAVGAYTFGNLFLNTFLFTPLYGVLISIAYLVFFLLFLTTLAGWIMGIVNALRGRYYKMPFVGDFAERYINRQSFPK